MACRCSILYAQAHMSVSYDKERPREAQHGIRELCCVSNNAATLWQLHAPLWTQAALHDAPVAFIRRHARPRQNRGSGCPSTCIISIPERPLLPLEKLLPVLAWIGPESVDVGIYRSASCAYLGTSFP